MESGRNSREYKNDMWRNGEHVYAVIVVLAVLKTAREIKNMWHFGHYWHFDIDESAKSVNNVTLRD